MTEPGGGRDDVLTLLARRRGLDFSDYRAEALERALTLRLRASGCQELGQYRHRLEEDPDEIEALIRSLVTPVTGFFRDRPVWSALEEVVLPALCRRFALVRALCVGVATGEEAWSLAMLLARAADLTPFEVIATDLDPAALEVARRGRYSAEALAAVPADLRRRFVEGDTLSPELGQHVRFARHDLVGRALAPPEAVVASFSLVLSRNVLIYFDARLQHKALDRLSAMLEPGGALVLGDAEGLPASHAARLIGFPAVDEHLAVFQRLEDRA